jgi:hypothetical protein
MEHALTLLFCLAAMTGTLTEGIHIPVHPGKPCVGVLMAGPYGKRMLDNGRGNMGAVYAGSLYSHMIEPLLPQFRVELMISSDPGESAAWTTWSQQFKTDIYVQIAEGPPLPERNATRFADTLCSTACPALWLQYGHLHNSYAMLQQREANDNVHFDYIVKTRVDIMYKPDNFMMPGWLFKLSANEVAVPSTEFHTGDRWMEREPSMWPNGMNDQIVFGPRSAMEKYFNLFWSKATIPNQYPQGPESVVSRYLVSCNIDVITVELQVSRPGCQNMPDCSAVNGMPEYGWVTTPCKLCMTA